MDEMVSRANRFIIQQGGTSSGKTYSILNSLIIKAAEKDGALISVVSESFPHLKRGAMRDFFNIIGEGYTERLHNKTNNTYRIGKSEIEFFSADQPDKVRGARRDYLFLNECNNIPFETFQQLEVRTKEQVYLDFNPVSAFWVHEKVLPFMDCYFRKSTYKDNPFLDQKIVKSIESRRALDANWWRVFGEGEIGVVDGLIFANFSITESFPELNYVYGLDFGFSNDETALVKVGISGQDLFLDEIIYQTGLTASDIVKELIKIGVRPGYDELFADSARPEIITEICRAGFNCKGAVKGQSSVEYGIDLMKRFNIKATKTSVNLIKEFRNYTWIKDSSGNATRKPADFNNHCIDAVRYALRMKVPNVGQRAIVI